MLLFFPLIIDLLFLCCSGRQDKMRQHIAKVKSFENPLLARTTGGQFCLACFWHYLSFHQEIAQSEKGETFHQKSHVCSTFTFLFVFYFCFFPSTIHEQCSLNIMFIKLSSQLNSYLETKLLQSEKKQLFILSNDM